METLEKQFSQDSMIEYMRNATKNASEKGDEQPFAVPE